MYPCPIWLKRVISSIVKFLHILKIENNEKKKSPQPVVSIEHSLYMDNYKLYHYSLHNNHISKSNYKFLNFLMKDLFLLQIP